MSKPKRRPSTEETITFNPKLSNDKKTFVLVAECSTPASWFEFLNFIVGWADQELKELDLPEDHNEH